MKKKLPWILIIGTLLVLIALIYIAQQAYVASQKTKDSAPATASSSQPASVSSGFGSWVEDLYISITNPGAEPRVVTPTYTGSSFEYTFLKNTPDASRLVIYAGQQSARSITDSGATSNNARTSPNSYVLEGQRIAFHVAAAGVLTHDNALIDKGLKAYEWGYAQMAPNGSFPLERAGDKQKLDNIHPLSFFLESGARTVAFILVSDAPQEYKVRAAALIPKMQLAAQYMSSRPSVDEFYSTAVDTNMLTTPIAAFQQIGLLAKDTTLTAKAKTLAERVLARQTADGTFPEKPKPAKNQAGLDSSYQTVSLDYMTRYATLLERGPWRTTVENAVLRGTNRFLSLVNPTTGVIDTSKNSRTGVCGPSVPGTQPKGREYDIIPIRIFYVSYLFGNQSAWNPIANKIQAVGQGFDHTEQCGGDLAD